MNASKHARNYCAGSILVCAVFLPVAQAGERDQMAKLKFSEPPWRLTESHLGARRQLLVCAGKTG